MHRLFWKIFLLFWVVNACVFALGIALSSVFRDTDRERRFPFDELAAAAIVAYQQDRLVPFYRQTRARHHASVFLLDSDDNLLPAGYYAKKAPPVIIEYPTHERKRHGSRTVVVRGEAVRSATGDTYRFIVRYSPRFSRKGRPPFLLPLFLITIAATSFLVAAYITRPLRKLQVVVRRFAGGERDARVSSEIAERRDVVGEVGHEFNVMAERLNATLESQRSLLRDISHEIRTPLARMQVAVALAEDNSSGAEPQLARLNTEIERLDKLVGQVLTLARLETGASKLHLETFELLSLLKEIAVDAEFEFSGQGKTIEFSGNQGSGSTNMVADREQLQSAFENIIRNGMRHTIPDTALRVIVYADTDALKITIRDHGPGVAETDLEKLFDAFFRLDSARTGDGNAVNGGHGVGLAITRGIIQSHGGTVSAANHPDGGLQVDVTLPRNTE